MTEYAFKSKPGSLLDTSKCECDELQTSAAPIPMQRASIVIYFTRVAGSPPRQVFVSGQIIADHRSPIRPRTRTLPSHRRAPAVSRRSSWGWTLIRQALQAPLATRDSKCTSLVLVPATPPSLLQGLFRKVGRKSHIELHHLAGFSFLFSSLLLSVTSFNTPSCSFVVFKAFIMEKDNTYTPEETGVFPSEIPLDALPKTRWQRSWPVIACGAGLFSDGYLQSVCSVQCAMPLSQF